MKISFLSCLLLMSSFFAFSQHLSNNEEIIKEVNALELKRFDAQVKKDLETLNNILSDDLIYTHSSGKVDSKASYLQSVKEGKTAYEAIISKEMNIHVFNKNTATISGACTFKLAGANPSIVELRYTDVYVKTKAKGWQLVAWQSVKPAPAN